jgi:Zinc dependent phospholipase C
MLLPALAIGGLLLVLSPAEAWAWGPSTHVWLANSVLSNLGAVPLPLRDLLSAYPYEFLYGNLSADITLAKKYVHYSRHCHRWEMGFLVLERAASERLRSFALGYLCHLAADTLAHNHFVPRRLLVTSSTRHFGHAYWEHRFDAQLGPDPLRIAREVVRRDHAGPDELLEEVLTQAIFSFRTNKRMFQHMLHLSNDERWQSLFEKMVARSRWDLPDEEVQRYLRAAEHIVTDFLLNGVRSRACGLDPIGSENLELAKKIRRRTIRDSRRESGRLLDVSSYPEEVAAVAEIFFELPRAPEGPPSLELSGVVESPQSDDRNYWERFRCEVALPT